MSTMTEKMSEAGTGRAPTKQKQQKHKPAQHSAALKTGDRFRCEECGMEIQVTADCPCEDADHVHFQCCDMDMQPV